MNIQMWVCGKYISEGKWEFQGVFSSERLAISACRDDNYFIGPAIVNAALDDETITWPGSYYPLLTDGVPA